MSIILGIDPGLNKTGWGIITKRGNHLSYIACGVIKSNSSQPMPSRLLSLHDGIREIIEIYKPNECAIEETFVNKNPSSSLKLGHARGALILAASLSGLSPYEYAATLVKKTTVGVGRAEKNQIMVMVQYLLPGAKINSEDAADALAVAICHSRFC